MKLSRVQQLIARRLTESKQTIPHFYVSNEVDMTDVLVMRQTLNADAGEEGVKVTVNDLVVKACALALEKFPEVNSSIKDDQLITYKHINVGFAVDVPTGLVVPVIRETNSNGVRSIARESKALIAKARANKLAPADHAAHEWYRFVLSFPPHLVRDYLARFGVTDRQARPPGEVV